MVESKDKETEEQRKRTQPLSFDRTEHLEFRKSPLFSCTLGRGRCGKVESWSSAVKAVMNSVY